MGVSLATAEMRVRFFISVLCLPSSHFQDSSQYWVFMRNICLYGEWEHKVGEGAGGEGGGVERWVHHTDPASCTGLALLTTQV